MQNNILILSRYNRLGASSRYRYYEYLNELNEAKLNCTISPLLSDKYLRKTYSGRSSFIEILRCYFKRLIVLFSLKKYDLCLIEKELFPFLPFYF